MLTPPKLETKFAPLAIEQRPDETGAIIGYAALFIEPDRGGEGT